MKSLFAGKSVDKTFLEHLEDLRKILIRVIICLALLFPLAMYFASGLIKFLVVSSCPPGLALNFFSPLEPVWVEIKTAMAVSVFIAFPYIAFEIWRFIAPGLYKHEKNFALRLVFVSWMLFIVGVLFCFRFILPLVMQFSMSMASDYLRPIIGLQSFISLTALLLLGFGIMFQFPVAIFLLVKTGLVKLETLKKQRSLMIIIILFLAAVITPTPDMLTQLIMAAPTYMLFELSLLITGFMVKEAETAPTGESESGDETPDSANELPTPESKVNFSGQTNSKNFPEYNRRKRKIRSRSRR
jgi:sec-independent protein translocase protein TatC